MRYSLGYVASPLPGDERFAGMISLPYLSRATDEDHPRGVVSIKFRSVGSQSSGVGKYAQPSGQHGRLFNSNAYFQASTSIGISEGEVDSIAASEYLGLPTMGVPGANGWRDEWKILMKDFVTVFVFADGDAAGEKFAYETADAIGWRSRVVSCPEGEDVSSMCAAGRASELLALMTTSNPEDEA